MLHAIRTPVTNYYHDYDDDGDDGGHDDDEDDHDHDDDDDDGDHEVDKMRVLLMIFQWGCLVSLSQCQRLENWRVPFTFITTMMMTRG